MKIAIANDHSGVELKNEIKKYIEEKYHYEVINFGTDSTESVDYPEIALKVAESVSNGECDSGILICRTGVGMSIVANKVRGIRCALCYNEKIGKLCKEHNNANVIAIPADMISFEEVICIIDNWISSNFLGGRHERRLNMIKDM